MSSYQNDLFHDLLDALNDEDSFDTNEEINQDKVPENGHKINHENVGLSKELHYDDINLETHSDSNTIYSITTPKSSHLSQMSIPMNSPSPVLRRKLENDFNEQSSEFMKSSISHTSNESSPGAITSLFQTASKKKITVKACTLKNAQKFENCDEIFQENSIHDKNVSLSTDSKKQVSSNVSLIPCQNDKIPNFDNNYGAISSHVSLFRTASNKKVSIQKANLETASKKIEDITNDEQRITVSNMNKKIDSPSLNTSSNISLFQTASKKNVMIKKENIANAAAILDEVKEISSEKEPLQSLFQTASRKKIEINSEKLTQAQQLVEAQSDNEISHSVDEMKRHSDIKNSETPVRKRKRSPNPTELATTKRSRFSQFQKDALSSKHTIDTPTKTPTKTSSRTPSTSTRKGKQFKSPRRTDNSIPINQSKTLPIFERSPSNVPIELKLPDWMECTTPHKKKVYISDFVKEAPLFNNSIRLNDDILYMTSENASEYQFPSTCASTNFLDLLSNAKGKLSDSQNISYEDFREILIYLGAKIEVVRKQWVQNHYRWIVWKCASTERKFPSHFQNYLSPEIVLKQLIYRYNCEYVRGKASVLKKIFETDIPSYLHMVLIVASTNIRADVFDLDIPSGIDAPTSIIECTDGWYSCNIGLDASLTRLVNWGKIREGTKLRLCNGTTFGVEGGFSSPLDIPETAVISYTVNSVRRAKWDAKVGLQNPSIGFKVNIASLQLNGGLVPQIQGVVERRYPLKFMEKLGQSKIFRSAVSEENAQQTHRMNLQYFIENYQDLILSQINMNHEQHLQRELKYIASQKIIEPNLIYTMAQSQSFKLTEEQNLILQRYLPRIQVERNELLKKKLEDTMTAKGITLERNVTPFFTVLMKDTCPYSKKLLKLPSFERDGGRMYKLTVWLASEAVYDLYEEGNHLKLSCLDISQSGSEEVLNLKTTSRTQTEQVTHSEYSRKDDENYTSKHVRTLSELKALVGKEEFDVIGTVIYISDKNTQQRYSETKLYIADPCSRNILLIKLRESDTHVCDWTAREGQSYIFENLSFSSANDNLFVCTANIDSTYTDSPTSSMKWNQLNQYNQISYGRDNHFEEMKGIVTKMINCDPSVLNSKKFLSTTDDLVQMDNKIGNSIIGNILSSDKTPGTIIISWQTSNDGEAEAQMSIKYPIPGNMFDTPDAMNCIFDTSEKLHNSDTSAPNTLEDVETFVTNKQAIFRDTSINKLIQAEFSFNIGDRSREISLDRTIISSLFQTIFKKKHASQLVENWLERFIQDGSLRDTYDEHTKLINAYRQQLWYDMSNIGEILTEALASSWIIDKNSFIQATSSLPMKSVEDLKTFIQSQMRRNEKESNNRNLKYPILFFEDEWERFIMNICKMLEEPMLEIFFGEDEKRVVSFKLIGFENIQDIFDLDDCI